MKERGGSVKVEGKDGREMRIEGGIGIELESMQRQKKTTFTKQDYIIIHTCTSTC